MPLRTILSGRAAERRAARWLRLRGYCIVDRAPRVGRGDIDLVAVKGRLVVFVEVRYRARGWADAALSIDRDKQRRFRRAVTAYRAREGILEIESRGDVILVTREGRAWRIHHAPGALPVS